MKNNNDIKNYFYLITEVIKKYLENHLKVLLSNDFIRRIKRGRYMINPLLIAKGREFNIRDLEYKYNSLKKEVVIGKK